MAAVAFVAALYNGRWKHWAFYSLVLGWVSQTIWLAREALVLNVRPTSTPYEWVAALTWLAVTAFAAYQRARPEWPLGGFLMPVAVVVWLGGQALPRSRELAPAGNVPAASLELLMLACVAFLLAAVFSIMYSEKERELKRKRVRLFYYQLPPLDVMDVVSARLAVAGLILLTLAVGLAAWWGEMTSRPVWPWVVHDVGIDLVWAAYAAYGALRIWGWQGHRAALYTMTAFLLVLANIFAMGLMIHGFSLYNG